MSWLDPDFKYYRSESHADVAEFRKRMKDYERSSYVKTTRSRTESTGPILGQKEARRRNESLALE